MGFWDNALSDMPATSRAIAPPAPPAPAVHAPAQPVQAYQPPPQQLPGGKTPETLSELLASGNVATSGGDAVKAGETLRCPQCGSYNYLTRSQGGVMGANGQLVAPAPVCFECGFNGRNWRQSTPQA